LRFRKPRTKRKPQEVKARDAFSIADIAAYDPGFLRVQLKVTATEARINARVHFSRLRLGPAMHDDVVGVPFERHVGTRVMHPLIEGEMQKDVREQRTDHTALRRSSFTSLTLPIQQHDVGSQPALDIQMHPPNVGKPTQGSQHKRMIEAIEERPDVDLEHPLEAPAALPRSR
jgi:hypothetical protein